MLWVGIVCFKGKSGLERKKMGENGIFGAAFERRKRTKSLGLPHREAGVFHSSGCRQMVEVELLKVLRNQIFLCFSSLESRKSALRFPDLEAMFLLLANPEILMPFVISFLHSACACWRQI